jgi:hypothetical protein
MKVTALFIVSLTFLAGCNAGPNKTNIELMQDMMDQMNVKSQDWDPDRPDKRANFVPPENTVPRGFSPYKFVGLALEAEAGLTNPMAGDFEPATLERGKAKYDIYCAVCHGATGGGDGTIAAKYMLPIPPLTSDKVKAFKDGRIFHIITDGQGLMGSYASQIRNESDRWAIVNYVRTLQRQAK